MAAFFRGLLLFLFGALVGAGGILFFTPTFNVVVSRNPGSLKPVEFAPAPAPAVAAVTPAPSAPTPQKYPVFTAPAEPASPAVAKGPAAEPAVDFKAISEHLILWPTAVSVVTATTVPILIDGKKVQELPLEAGTPLQLSKVLADGSLEVRAKGMKFEIKSGLTDFTAELSKRVADLVAKGTKVDSPFVAPATAPAAVAVAVVSAPAPAASAAAPVAAPVAPKGPLTLAQKVDVLFGNKPEAPAASVAPVAAPAAPTVAVPAAPAADPKAAEKGKDLDRKINQLFK